MLSSSYGLQLGSTYGKRFKNEKKDQNFFFLKIDKKDSSTSIVKKDFKPEKGYNYRIVHNLQAAKAQHNEEEFFIDPEYTINPKEEFPK